MRLFCDLICGFRAEHLTSKTNSRKIHKNYSKQSQQPCTQLSNISFLTNVPPIKLAIWLMCCHITIMTTAVEGQSSDDLARLLGRCPLGSDDFDSCMKDVFNDLRAYFSTGIPEFNIRPFDPHRSPFVEQRRGDRNGIAGYKLILRNVSEYGWARSEVTKYRTDMDNRRIIYSQYFPEKSLDGSYEFSGTIFGRPLKRQGVWNMTLYDYSQTTSVRRLGEPGSLLKVHVEINQIGGMRLHISNLIAAGRQNINNFADGVINSTWKLGFPILKPLINELVSTAFTDIFNESFRHFSLENFIF